MRDRVFGMGGYAVIALAIIFHGELPVARDRIVLPMGDLGAIEPVRRERRREIVRDRVERHRVRVEIEEDEPCEYAAMQAAQAVLRAIEALGRVSGRAQGPIEPVGPAVITADQPHLVSGRRVADARSAVPADIEERVDPAFGVAHDDDRLTRHLEKEIVAFRRNLALVPDEVPALEEDPLDFLLVEGRVAVDRARQRKAGAPGLECVARAGGHGCHAAAGCRRFVITAAVATATATSAMMMVVIALISGVTPSLTLAKISIGRVVAPGPDTKLEITRSSSESANASSQPEIRAGSNVGTVMSKKTATGLPPRSMAASSSDSSMVARRARTTTTT